MMSSEITYELAKDIVVEFEGEEVVKQEGESFELVGADGVENGTLVFVSFEGDERTYVVDPDEISEWLAR